jgi:uncharacterized protein (TIGR02996 family)
MFDTPEWLALCRAVVKQPEDDLPRLLAADWLEEHGQSERAEYIRVQLELAKEPTPALHWRERALWNQPAVGALWAMEMCPSLLSINMTDSSGSGMLGWNRQPVTDITFQRGFPQSVRTTAMHWLDHGRELIPQYPVRVVRLTLCERPMEADWWRLAGLLEGVGLLEFNCRVNLADRLRGRLESAGTLLRIQDDRRGSQLMPVEMTLASDRETPLPPPRPMLPAG